MSITKELLLERGEFNHTEEDEMELHHSYMAEQALNKSLDQRIGEECQRRQLNRAVIAQSEKTFGKLRDAQIRGHCPNEIINYLNILGLRCLGCGKNNITFPVLKYCDFSESVKCRACQYI